MASRRTIVILSSGSEDDDIEVVAAVQHRRRPRTPPPRPMLDESIIFIDSGGKATGPHRKRSLSQEIPPQEHSLQDAVMFQEADQYGFTDEIISPLEMEQRKAIFKQLAEIYGDEDMGFGFKGKIVKVGGEDVPRSFTVTVIPQANQSTNGVPKKFFFMTVVNPENPEYGGAFKVFPPIRVKVEYLTNATREVKIMLTCSWLRKDHVKSLTSSMHDNLLRYHGDVIGCLDWLERNGIHSLSLLDGVGKIYYSSRNHQANYIVFHDPRAVLGLFLAHTKRVEEREKTALGTSRVFDCDICFEHKPSLAAHIFDECKHFFCRACVGQDWQIKIQDAQLGDLACPAKDCKSKGNLEMIRDLVDFNSFRRYCDLTTESLCDTMATIVRCPRKECNVPMELHPEAAKEVTCLHCRYQFCSACKGKQHPNEPCLSEDQKKQIREEWAAADNVEKEALKKRYGADNVKFALEDAESQTWISANSKPCPKCKAPIQKVDGCNKMVCSSKGCRTYFCWLCLAVLDQQHPYNHFNPGQSGCANQLHTGAIGGGPPNILAYRAAAVQGAPVRLQLAPVAVGAAPGALNIGMMIRPRAHPRRAAPPRARRAVRNNVAAAVPGLDADAHNRAREAMEAARAERDRQRLEREERARLRAGQRAHRGGAREDVRGRIERLRAQFGLEDLPAPLHRFVYPRPPVQPNDGHGAPVPPPPRPVHHIVHHAQVEIPPGAGGRYHIHDMRLEPGQRNGIFHEIEIGPANNLFDYHPAQVLAYPPAPPVRFWPDPRPAAPPARPAEPYPFYPAAARAAYYAPRPNPPPNPAFYQPLPDRFFQ